jgi:hypothetical protein
MVESVVARAEQSMEAQQTILYQVYNLARPALAFAAAAAVAIWIGVASTETDASGTTVTDPAYAVSTWASGGEIPSTARIIEIMGEGNVN